MPSKTVKTFTVKKKKKRFCAIDINLFEVVHSLMGTLNYGAGTGVASYYHDNS